ncbi:MAG: hypothetical protein E7269_07990 [Lachnospiraceae bacterium]|nr:hypothetical protein [Lachnospiraceae bacterium]
MRNSKRQVRRLYQLYLSLIALSAVFVVLLTVEYRAYLKDLREHSLTVSSNQTLPTVGESLLDETSDVEVTPNPDIKDEPSIHSTSDSASDTPDTLPEPLSPDVRATLAEGAIVIGDTDLLKIYTYNAEAAINCTKTGISAASISNATFKVSEKFSKKQTTEQVLSFETYSDCYLFFGLYESEWYYIDAFFERYETFIERVKELQPEATIYIHALPSADAISAASIDISVSPELVASINAELAALAEKTDTTFVIFE